MNIVEPIVRISRAEFARSFKPGDTVNVEHANGPMKHGPTRTVKAVRTVDIVFTTAAGTGSHLRFRKGATYYRESDTGALVVIPAGESTPLLRYTVTKVGAP